MEDLSNKPPMTAQMDGKLFSVFKLSENLRKSFRLSSNKLEIKDTDDARRQALENSKRKLQDIVAAPLPQILVDFNVNPSMGLSSQEAAARLKDHGPNELAKEPPTPLWKMFLEQFADLLVMMLVVSSFISIGLGEYPAAVVIIIIVLANAWLGVTQEAKAGAAIEALESLSAPQTQVTRDGKRGVMVNSCELVPGDIVELETGQKISADIRLLTSQDLQCNEMALTGESEGRKKDAHHLPPAASKAEVGPNSDEVKGEKKKKEEELTDRNMVYMGCSVIYGRGTGVVVKTGMQTKMGEIAHLLKTAEKGMSPLQQKLHHLGVRLGIASLAISFVVFIVGVSTGRGSNPESSNPVWLQMLLVAISLTVAAVPEGLPACVTITLAVGMERMAKKNALIRNLHSVETLGSATVICSDKTGTLTKGQMTAVRLWFQDQTYRITGEGFDPVGQVIPVQVDHTNKQIVEYEGKRLLESQPHIKLTFFAATLCCNADIQFNEETKQWEAVNSPSERPLVVAAYKVGIRKAELDKEFPRLKENPFNSQRKMMSTLVDFCSRIGSNQMNENSSSNISFSHFMKHHPGMKFMAVVKGAPNIVLENSVSMVTRGGDGTMITPLQQADRERILKVIDDFSEQSFRVLAMAYQPFDARPLNDAPEELEKNLVLVGLIASIDPERPEVAGSIRKAASAGIRTVMITGDYVKTAKAIAENIGLIPKNAEEGVAIDCERVRQLGMEIEELEAKLKLPGAEKAVIEKKIGEVQKSLDSITAVADVYARAKPADKITIVRSLQRQGHVCSMTGDGVNDAPALRQANIGVAMGITGTDVAKGSADMILTDDNFTSIVEAVEEGRTIYANITKFVFFLLSTNVSEVFLILVAVLMGLESPLSPIQILWMNLTTDGLPAIALALEKIEPGTMDQGPRLLSENILEKVMVTGIIIQTIVLTAQHLTTYIVGMYWFTGAWNGRPDGGHDSHGIAQAQTMVILSVVFSELLRAYSSRSLRVSIFEMGVFSNRFMQISCFASVALTVMVATIPGVQDIFGLKYIDGRAWIWVIFISFLAPIVHEVMKYVYRKTGFGKRPLANLQRHAAMVGKTNQVLPITVQV